MYRPPICRPSIPSRKARDPWAKAARRYRSGGRVELRQQHDLLGRLDHLERHYEHVRGDAVGKTLRMGIGKRIFLVALVSGGSRRPQRLLFGLESPEDVHHVLVNVVKIDLKGSKVVAQHAGVLALRRAFGLPQSGQIGVAVQTWRRRGQVRLAIPGTWRSRVGMIQPLRSGAHKGPGEQDSDLGASIKHLCIVPSQSGQCKNGIRSGRSEPSSSITAGEMTQTPTAWLTSTARPRCAALNHFRPSRRAGFCFVIMSISAWLKPDFARTAIAV